MKTRNLCLLSIVVVVAFGSVASAIQWDGGGSGDLWSTAANWAGDAKPGDGESASFGFTASEVVDCSTTEPGDSNELSDFFLGYTTDGATETGAVVNVKDGGNITTYWAATGLDSVLNIETGGTFTSTADYYLGIRAGQSSTINVNGGTFNIPTGMGLLMAHIGAGNSAALNVNSGTANIIALHAPWSAGGPGNTAEVNVAGGLLNVAGDVLISQDPGGHGSMTVSGGQVVVGGELHVPTYSDGTTCTLDVTGGDIDIAGITYIGYGDSGAMTMSSGTFNADSTMYLGYAACDGSLAASGDAEITVAGDLFVNHNSVGFSNVLTAGGTSSIDVGGTLHVGYGGGGTVGTVTLSDTATLEAGAVSIASSTAGGDGTITVGTGTMLTTGELYVPHFDNAGDDTAMAHLQVNGGLVHVTTARGSGAGPSGDAFTISAATAGNGTIDVDGGVVMLKGDYSTEVAAAVTAGDITADGGTVAAAYDYNTSYLGYTAIYSSSQGLPAVEFCLNKPTGDLDDNCKENLADFAIFAAEWLDCGIYPQANCN